MTTALSGKDVLIINGRKLNDFGTGDCVTVTYPNEKVTVKTGKNGNAVYGLNETGRQADVTVKVIRSSPDDKFLNGLKAQQDNNFEEFVLMFGEFIKRIGDSIGGVANDTMILKGGVFSKNQDAKSNVEGDTDQSETTYTMRFADVARAIT